MLLDKKDSVIMDMGAGIEHLSRGTARGVDMMLVVVEPGRNSINTANHVIRMAGELGIAKTGIIANKIRSEKEKQFIIDSLPGHKIMGFIKFSESIWANAMEPSMSIEAEKELLSEINNVCINIWGEAGGNKSEQES